MRKIAIAVTMVSLLLAAAPFAAQAKTIKWSGYSWNLRTGTGGPGGITNQWSERNVTVKGGQLQLRIAKQAGKLSMAEVWTTRNFGYGKYTWVVNSNLNKFNPMSVVAMFTYSPAMSPSFGERDWEFTGSWGIPGHGRGEFVSWRSPNDRTFGQFQVSNAPPYTCTVLWSPIAVRLKMVDRNHRVLKDITVPSNLTPSGVAAHISFWAWNDRLTTRTYGPVIFQSFKYAPPR